MDTQSMQKQNTGNMSGLRRTRSSFSIALYKVCSCNTLHILCACFSLREYKLVSHRTIWNIDKRGGETDVGTARWLLGFWDMQLSDVLHPHRTTHVLHTGFCWISVGSLSVTTSSLWVLYQIILQTILVFPVIFLFACFLSHVIVSNKQN